MKLLIEYKNIKLDNAQKIIGTRNRIIHGYDKISDDMIWSIVINHLPKLKDEVSGLLNEWGAISNIKPKLFRRVIYNTYRSPINFFFAKCLYFS